MALPKNDFVIRIGGDTAIGGVISTGENFTAAAARLGFRTFTFRTYPAEIRGGHAWFQVRISNQPIYSIGDGCDQEAYEIHRGDLNEGGVLIYDSDLVHPQDGRFIPYAISFQRIARQELDFVHGTNVLILGVMAGLFGLAPSSLEELVRSRYRRRAELMEKNLEALHYGYEYTKKIKKRDGFWLGTTDHVACLVMTGNDAIAAGALHAGCRYFAGYPITPASDILETMAVQLPRFSGVCLQAEDEISALASVIGASYAGTKAMTATSGSGFSLMTELLGLASMAEIPLVIVDAQRSGPSTGMPTKLEQGGLFQALYGGHGDFPRIVVAPGSVRNCFRVAVLAFGLAEKYQCPVILLSDQSLSYRTETIERVDADGFPIVERLRPNGVSPGEYRRYQITDNGVSPMAIPGLDPHTYVTPGLEHDELGHPYLSPENYEAMTAKRPQDGGGPPGDRQRTAGALVPGEEGRPGDHRLGRHPGLYPGGGGPGPGPGVQGSRHASAGAEPPAGGAAVGVYRLLPEDPGAGGELPGPVRAPPGRQPGRAGHPPEQDRRATLHPRGDIQEDRGGIERCLKARGSPPGVRAREAVLRPGDVPEAICLRAVASSGV